MDWFGEALRTYKSDDNVFIALRYRNENTIYSDTFTENSFLFGKVDLLFVHILAIYQYLCDFVLVKVV